MSETLILDGQRRLSRFQAFLVGGGDGKALIARITVMKGFYVSDEAEDLMDQPAFTTQDSQEVVETGVFTPADFDDERELTTAELFDPIWLAAWSRQNADRLPEGYDAVELLPAESGPHIRIQCMDQNPNGDILWIAMEPIAGSDGCLRVFEVRRYSDLRWSLHAGEVNPDEKLPSGRRFLYRLRKAA